MKPNQIYCIFLDEYDEREKKLKLFLLEHQAWISWPEYFHIGKVIVFEAMHLLYIPQNCPLVSQLNSAD